MDLHTDLSGVGCTEAPSGAFLSPDDDELFERLDESSADRRDRLGRQIATLPTEKILKAYRHCIRLWRDDAEEWALAFGAELDRRGIAPVFRLENFELPERRSPKQLDRLSPDRRQKLEEHLDAMLKDALRLVLLCDLQWLRSRYPLHRTLSERRRGVFSADYDKALKAWDFAWWNGHAMPARLTKEMALTDEQVQELAWIKPAHVGRIRDGIMARRHQVAAQLKAAASGSRDHRTEAEKIATLERRLTVWECGELAGWKPTRTADLLAMKPDGVRLPRSVVGRDLDYIKRVVGEKRNTSTGSHTRPRGT